VGPATPRPSGGGPELALREDDLSPALAQAGETVSSPREPAGDEGIAAVAAVPAVPFATASQDSDASAGSPLAQETAPGAMSKTHSGADVMPVESASVAHPGREEAQQPEAAAMDAADPVELAIRWVMDDPHWRGKAERQVSAMPDDHAADGPQSDLSERRDPPDPGRDPARPAGPARSTRTHSAADAIGGAPQEVQVHIGRLAIEVHQAAPPRDEPPAAARAAVAGPSTRTPALSGSRLRRLYLRGI
jgi:hypothetical protein